MAFNFTKAKRERAKLKVCLTGASGGGKTLSSLYLAYGMTGDWGKIAVIDSERGRALMYANRSDLGTGEFLHCDLEPPYTVDRYIEAMREAEKLSETAMNLLGEITSKNNLSNPFLFELIRQLVHREK
jgi:hypothetical protein